MNAYDQGCVSGSKYIREAHPEQTTIQEMGSAARSTAKQRYKSEEKQQEFVKGWLATSQPFFSLFSDFPTKLSIMGVTFRCELCHTTFDLEYDQPIDLSVVRIRKTTACPVCDDTGQAKKEMRG